VSRKSARATIPLLDTCPREPHSIYKEHIEKACQMKKETFLMKVPTLVQLRGLHMRMDEAGGATNATDVVKGVTDRVSALKGGVVIT